MMENENADGLVIRTSKSSWLRDLARAYKERQPALVVDDANIGIDPRIQSLLEMGKKADLSKQEWLAVLTCLGLSAVGVWLVLAAIRDPEPTSRLFLLLAGGVVSIIGGGFSAVRILTKEQPLSIEVTGKGLKIKWP